MQSDSCRNSDDDSGCVLDSRGTSEGSLAEIKQQYKDHCIWRVRRKTGIVSGMVIKVNNLSFHQGKCSYGFVEFDTGGRAFFHACQCTEEFMFFGLFN